MIKPGYYYNISSARSMTCSNGTFSYGNKIAFTSWNPLPTEFTTTSRNGLPWKAEGDYITTGFQPNDNISTTLTFHHRTFDGEQDLTVTYKVSSEESSEDGFTILINNKTVLPLTHRTVGWAKATFHLTEGIHIVDFVFKKRGYASSWPDYASIRNISITGASVIPLSCTPCPKGTYASADHTRCYPCPAGTFSSLPGQTSCTSCNNSTHFALAGSDVCTQRPRCTEEDYIPTPSPCTNGKRTITFSRHPHSVCYNPPDSTDGVAIPAQKKNVDCLPCPFNTYRKDKSDQCVSCGENAQWQPKKRSTNSLSVTQLIRSNEHNDNNNDNNNNNENNAGSSGSCQKCADGTYALPVTHITSSMNAYNEIVSLSCSSPHSNLFCAGITESVNLTQSSTKQYPGWKYNNATAAYELDGPFVGPVSAVLNISVSVPADSTGSLGYTLSLHLLNSSRLTVSVDGYPLKLYTYMHNSATIQEKLTLLPSDHIVSFVFSNEARSEFSAGNSKNLTEDSNEHTLPLFSTILDQIGISGIYLSGMNTNINSSSSPSLPLYSPTGGFVCAFCPIGSFSNSTSSSRCSKCPRGSFSTQKGSSNCTRCPAGFVSLHEGAAECIRCPAGTTADTLQHRCELTQCGATLPLIEFKIPQMKKTEDTLNETKSLVGRMGFGVYDENNDDDNSNSNNSNNNNNNNNNNNKNSNTLPNQSQFYQRYANLTGLMSHPLFNRPILGTSDSDNLFYFSACNSSATERVCSSVYSDKHN